MALPPMPDTKPVIDYAAAVELAQQQVDAKGENFVYQRVKSFGEDTRGRCVNWVEVPGETEDDESTLVPSCIMGHIYQVWDVLPEVDQVDSVGIALHKLLQKFTITDKAEAFFEELQGNQDIGMPWGRALEYAKYIVEVQQSAGRFTSDEEYVPYESDDDDDEGYGL